jgi:tetratricopeptide (TPR) repeat protein
MLRARIAESQGRLEQALGNLKHIPDSDAIGSQAWLKAGQIELARHDARGAESAFRRALALDPDQIQAYRELAYLYAVQRRREECDAQFRALAKRISLDYVLAFAWCQNYCDIWDPDESCRVLGEFVAFDPDDRLLRLALANNLRLAHRLDEAEAALGPLADSDPEARALRAELAIDQGAIDAAQDLARAGPADHSRLNAVRGRLALINKNAAGAVDYFWAALRDNPEDHESIRALGLALRLVGDRRARACADAAQRYDDFKRALQASTITLYTDPKLFYKLGEYCQALRRTIEARTWYQLAIKRDPSDVQAQLALDRLGQVSDHQSSSPKREF